MLPNNTNICDLMYGHDGKYISSIKGKFAHHKSKPPMQLFNLACGCWIVLDGNNRIGSILNYAPDAKIGDFPKNTFVEIPKDKFDANEIYYWVPYPKPFHYIIPLSQKLNKIRHNKSSYNLEEYNKEINSIYSLLTKEVHICHSKNSQQYFHFLRIINNDKTQP